MAGMPMQEAGVATPDSQKEPAIHRPRDVSPAAPWAAAPSLGPPDAAPVAAASPKRRRLRVRTVWISDVHLGSRSSKAERLLDFLRHVTSEHLFLVGDIIDGWTLEDHWYWPHCHGEVVRELLRSALDGMRVTYLYGNHDEFVRRYTGRAFAGIAFCREVVHTLRDGRRMLVTHGDCFDSAANKPRWLARLGGRSLEWAHWLCGPFGLLQRRLGLPWRSWLACVREWMEDAATPVRDYETFLLGEVRRRGLDGIVCGHNHRPDLSVRAGLVYGNDGDWVESCTALVEHLDGRLELLRWPA